MAETTAPQQDDRRQGTVGGTVGTAAPPRDDRRQAMLDTTAPRQDLHQDDRRQRTSAAAAPLVRMCGDDSRAIAGLPVFQIQQAITPTEAQRATLDELTNASILAARLIRDTCPTEVATTAPGRLAAMQQRIEAMITASAMVQTPLDKLYSGLSDDQKARFVALADDRRKNPDKDRSRPPASGDALPMACGGDRGAAPAWPVDEIEKRLHPTAAQRTALLALRDTNTRAAELIRTSCRDLEAAKTPPARLEATAKRLGVMLQALVPVRSALNNFYATLNDDQKAQFEGIGRPRPAT